MCRPQLVLPQHLFWNTQKDTVLRLRVLRMLAAVQEEPLRETRMPVHATMRLLSARYLMVLALPRGKRAMQELPRGHSTNGTVMSLMMSHRVRFFAYNPRDTGCLLCLLIRVHSVPLTEDDEDDDLLPLYKMEFKATKGARKPAAAGNMNAQFNRLVRSMPKSRRKRFVDCINSQQNCSTKRPHNSRQSGGRNSNGLGHRSPTAVEPSTPADCPSLSPRSIKRGLF